jgi:hypothetical protein
VFEKTNDNTFKIKIYGGFIYNNKDKNEFIRKSHKNVISTQLNNLDIVNTINYLSSVKFCINNNVLNFILNLINNNDDRIFNLIKINLHPKTKDIFKLNLLKYKNQNELNEILKHNSQYYNDNTILQTALLFSD